jgi:ankyrin repeat protein
MDDIWKAAAAGDVGEVERLLGQDPGLLDARTDEGYTPLMAASHFGHVSVARWLLSKGAGINGRGSNGCTALWIACCRGQTPVVRLLVERGADPTIGSLWGSTLLMAASINGHVEAVRFLLGEPSAKAGINYRDKNGETALWWACSEGRGGVVRMLLESGADPTIAKNDGTTPMAIAKTVSQQDDDVDEDEKISAEGRRECVAALEVRPHLCDLISTSHSLDQLAEASGIVLPPHVGRSGSGPTSSGRPGRWPTSRGAARWRCRGGGGAWR